MKKGKYTQLFQSFDQLRIMVIGDVMLDAYLWGSVDRISPEAPIPIVALRKRENRLGGAANVALNIHALGATPILCSVIGQEDKGDQFIDLLQGASIPQSGIVRSGSRTTTTKFRIFGNQHQMLRVDEEDTDDLNQHDLTHLMDRIQTIIRESGIDAIIFQDYNKGVITRKLIQQVIAMAQELQIPIAVDPKKRNFSAYKGVTLFKPNLKELREGVGQELDATDEEKLMEAASALRAKLQCRYVMTTLSEKGMLMTLDDPAHEPHLMIPSFTRSVADVSGAGDTVISVATACLARSCTPYEIAYISNLAGGLVCEEVGVVPVSKEKLLHQVEALL